MTYRGTTNKNQRGGSEARRRRRAFLLMTFDTDLGPLHCRCALCGITLDDSTITVDRKLPGCHGGTYKRDNIQPSCQPCASETGGHLGVAQKREKRSRGLNVA